MQKKQLVAIVVGIIIILVAIVAYIVFKNRKTEPVYAPGVELTEKGPILEQFAGAGYDSPSQDSAALGRVVRGNMDSVDFENNAVVMSAQINWPNDTPRRKLPFKLMPNSEFLCWPKTFTTGDGTQANYETTIFLLDSTHKLFAPGQTTLSRDEAANALSQGMPVIFALQSQYAATGINNVFQIAIIGCQ